MLVLVVLALHVALAVMLGPAVARLGRRAFALAGLAPVAAVALAVLTAGPAGVGGEPWITSLSWVDRLGLGLRFEMDALAWLLTVLVGGVGATVVAFAGAYAAPDPTGRRMVALLVAFVGSMLGLVWAADVWTLFLFWEATTICSFLLVGNASTDVAAIGAARRALVVTGLGGLALLGGLVVLADAAGSTSLDRVASVDTSSGAAVGVAALAVLLASATKSALWPFSGWLPGAMAAPAPVSALLHSATMVKVGVLTILVVAPAFSSLDAWRPLVLLTGGAALLLGGWRALAEDDLKLLLAHSTVSQLGLIAVLAGIGVDEATFAALAIVVAHAVFKAALFLAVGAAEQVAGTRDRHELAGIGRHRPALAVTVAVAGASMAGVAPTLGFVAKEAGLEALVGRSGLDLAALGLVLSGSVLTAAYTLRLVAPFVRTGPARVRRDVPAAMRWSPASLAVVSLAAGLGVNALSPLVARGAAVAVGTPVDKSLKLVPGWTVALGLSVAVLVLGVVVHAWSETRPTVGGVASGTGVDRAVDAVIAGSRRLTARLQHGSLPGYLVVVLLTATAAPLLVLATGVSGDLDVEWSTSPFEVAGAVVVLVGTVAAVRSRRRLSAVLATGAVGYGVGAVFLARGAPDLALTQLLVETTVVVGFVLVLRHLPERFGDRDERRLRLARPIVAGCVGVFVFVLAATALSARSAEPATDELIAASRDGGGRNVVNIVLTNFRALDTLGEITVVVAALLGVAALVGAGRAETTEGGAA